MYYCYVHHQVAPSDWCSRSPTRSQLELTLLASRLPFLIFSRWRSFCLWYWRVNLPEICFWEMWLIIPQDAVPGYNGIVDHGCRVDGCRDNDTRLWGWSWWFDLITSWYKVMKMILMICCRWHNDTRLWRWSSRFVVDDIMIRSYEDDLHDLLSMT